MANIHLGFEKETGEPIDIPVMHTSMTGITRHGKSETMTAMVERVAEQGYTVLLFDVKTQRRDYEGIGQEIPIYLEEATDPTTVKGLLEQQSGMSLSFQYAEIVKVYEPGDDYRSMQDRIDTLLDDDHHPVREDKLEVLHHLLSRLVDELDAVTIADDLELHEGVNVMDLSDVGDSIQQLAVASTVREVLDNHEEVIIGIDEASDFIPQKAEPPSNQPIVETIRKGAASSVWMWLSDQTITGVDKDPLKQVGVWLLGKQREKNEAKRVRDQIPGGKQYSNDDVMTLEKGHFICALDEGQPLVYVQPSWLDEETARRIATGEQSLEEVTEPVSEDIDELEEELAQKDSRIADLKAELEERDERIQELESQVEKMNALLEEQEAVVLEGGEPEPVETEVDEDRVREVIEEYIQEAEVPEGITIREEVPAIELVRTIEPLELDESTLKGKIAILYAEGDLPSEDWFTTGDLYELMEARGWSQDPRGSTVMDEFCSYGYFEKHYAGNRPEFRMKLTPEEAQEQGLLEIETEVA